MKLRFGHDLPSFHKGNEIIFIVFPLIRILPKKAQSEVRPKYVIVISSWCSFEKHLREDSASTSHNASKNVGTSAA